MRLVSRCVIATCLVIFANLVGWLGGAAVSAWNQEISVSWSAFFGNLRQTVEARHLAHGLFKAFVFALTIGVVSCHQGLATIGGPRGIGRSVTKAVVNSIALILLLDYVLTRLLLPFDR